MNYESSTANTDLNIANLFNQYFYSVFHDSSSLPNIDDLPPIHNSLSSITISPTDVFEVLVSLDVEKSPGMDKISPRVLRNCAVALTEPLHHLFSLSLCYATLPSSWKIHKVVPIPKAGDLTSVKNYRPISLLSNTSKVLERIIYNKIINHISKDINPRQFGFTKNCSALQQMLIFLDQIINSPLQTDVIYFDISKAFDTVSHGILLKKLWSIGITSTLWSWFKDYLSNRYQRVTINNSYSDPLPVVSGVPQGNITAIFTWSLDSAMDFNFKKFIHLSFKSKLDTIYTISDTRIPRSDCHKDLGIILSVDLSWDKHYKTITSRAYKLLGLIRRTLSSCHSTTTITRLYVSLVRSQLFYCTQVWRPHLMRDILNIERVQRATKYILNDYTSSYKTRLILLNLLPLMYLFELHDILFAIKSLKSPTIQFNITNYINFNPANTRSGASNKLIPTHHLNNLSRHSYFHRLPSLWNAMPVIDLNMSFAQLKSKLKKYLWDHFLNYFDDNNNCTLHYQCPCSRCHLSRPPTSNFTHL